MEYLPVLMAVHHMHAALQELEAQMTELWVLRLLSDQPVLLNCRALSL